MPTYVIVAVGEFRGPDRRLKSVDIPQFGGAKAAGFYTTRIVSADDPNGAAERAADSIYEELLGSIGKENSVFSLEIESCEEVPGPPPDISGSGFSFFGDD
jgi:hypothetical protein